MKDKSKQKPQHVNQIVKYAISWAVVAFVLVGVIITVFKK